MALHGDDELDAVLAEMCGGGTSAKTGAADRRADEEQRSPSPPPPLPTDARLSDPPLRWPPSFRLKESLDGGSSCRGWKKNDKTDGSEKCHGHRRCAECGKPPAFHRIKANKANNKSILWQLFCHVRNIRAAAVSRGHDCSGVIDKCWKKIHQSLEDDMPTNRLSSVDAAALREKAKDLGDALRQRRRGDSDMDGWSRMLQVLMKADALYHRVYYASLTSPSEGERHVPHPPTYLWMSVDVDELERHGRKFADALDADARSLLVETYGLFDADDTNPLHTLWRLRFYETVSLFWNSGYATKTTAKALAQASIREGNMHGQFAIHETLADPLLAEWRDVTRDFPASLYAYATPSPRALRVVRRNVSRGAALIEMGAGTGYWAALLQGAGVDVTPYDRSPPGTYSDNEYHSEVPAFTTVEARDSSHMPAADALFLCYPPPGNDMAFTALRGFGGETVFHVGEWAGLTGDSSFERLLTTEFGCIEHVPLPTWGTDAAYLTVWRRGAPKVCSAAVGGCVGCDRPARKRCRYARQLQYCSRECFDSNEPRQKHRLRMQMLDADESNLCWGEPRHFMELVDLTRQGGSSAKKRGKKRRRPKVCR